MIRVLDSALRVVTIRTRMPFRYGIAELTETPHLFCQLTVEVDGVIAHGLSADSLVPKWFTKDPAQSYQDEIDAMLQVIGMAVEHARQASAAANPFRLWWQTMQRQSRWATQTAHPPLLWNFGVTLVERALIDAWCRVKEMSFHAAVHSAGADGCNLLGLDLGAIHSELQGREAAGISARQAPLPGLCTPHGRLV